MGIQLYPPIIPAKLNAMYETEGIVKITIPFELNKTVAKNQIDGFEIQLKSAYTNTFIGKFQIIATDEMKNNQIITGEIPNIENNNIESRLTLGDFYKIQVAFINDNTIGYYSSVGTAKYAAAPTLIIENLDSTTINNFTYSFKGLSTVNENDPTEIVDYYKFDIYSKHGTTKNILTSSDWILKNQNADDEYTFSDIPTEIIYYIQYSAKTINGLEVFSPEYQIQHLEVIVSELEGEYTFAATNNYDNGYVELSLEAINNPGATIEGMFRILRKKSNEDLYIELSKQHIVLPTNSWTFKDFLIEQGETYTYAIQQYNNHGFYSIKIETEITTDFEDMFLYDGGTTQLKIKFNPKISSFKINRQEQKQETIGSQFPFFTRNGKIAYHEFPISGLISYWMDEEELFMTDEELGLVAPEAEPRRQQTEHSAEDELPPQGLNYRTHRLEGYNFAAERKFKNKVLEWLGNGKPKFFKSPQEGNFIVRIMNASLSPDDKLNRLLHTFSSTAYEAMEITSQNLKNYGFYYNNDNEEFNGTGRVFNKIISTEKLDSNIVKYINDPSCSINPRELYPNDVTCERFFKNTLFLNAAAWGNIKTVKLKRKQFIDISTINFQTNYPHYTRVYPSTWSANKYYIKNDQNQYIVDRSSSQDPDQEYYSSDIICFNVRIKPAFLTDNNNLSILQFNSQDGIPDVGKIYFVTDYNTATVPYQFTNDLYGYTATQRSFIYIKTGATDSWTNVYRAISFSKTANPYWLERDFIDGQYSTQPYYYSTTSADKNCTQRSFGAYTEDSKNDYVEFPSLTNFLDRCAYIHSGLYLEIEYYSNYKAIYDLSE